MTIVTHFVPFPLAVKVVCAAAESASLFLSPLTTREAVVGVVAVGISTSAMTMLWKREVFLLYSVSQICYPYI